MPTNSAINIQFLQQAPEHFAQVASWHHQECERQGLQSSLSVRQQRLLTHVQDDEIPKTIIAVKNEELLGCVSLVNYTYRGSERMPKVSATSSIWLSNLYVPDHQREHGIGNVLIEAAKKYATDLGLHELWLSAAEYTDYYQKRGWETTRRTRLGGRQVNIMRIDLNHMVNLDLTNSGYGQQTIPTRF